MRTLNQVLDTLETIATSHGELNGFQFGLPSEHDNAKENVTKYPFLFVAPPEVTQGPGVVVYDLPISVAQPIQDDHGDRRDVWSDLLQTIMDVVNNFRHNLAAASEANGESLGPEVEVVFSPFTDEKDNMLTGWECVLVLRTEGDNNLCLSP